MASIRDAGVEFENRLHGRLVRHSIPMLRIAVGAVFLGFGVLKFFPHVSPVENLATKTIDELTLGLIAPGVGIVAIAAGECFIGICLLFNRWMRVAVWLLALELVGILAPLFLLSGRLFSGPHGAPTLEGQYVLKDIVLVAAGMVIAAGSFRGGRLVRDEFPALSAMLANEALSQDAGDSGQTVLGEIGEGRPLASAAAPATEASADDGSRLPVEGLHHVRSGSGTPLLLIHGLGGSLHTWDTVSGELARHREVIAIDLPGFGATAPLPGRPTVAALAGSVAGFLEAHDLEGVDVVGSSMGARLALELARRGKVGATVALDPGGFWNKPERRFFSVTVGASVRLISATQPAMRMLTANPLTRTLLFLQFSAHPWRLPGDVTLTEMRSFAASPAIRQTLHELVAGPLQEGAPEGSTRGPVVIGWGRQDRVTLPSQAARARERFPDAQLHWFEGCGHFPHWDAPDATVRLILANTGNGASAGSR